jgi:hypothetical protein
MSWFCSIQKDDDGGYLVEYPKEIEGIEEPEIHCIGGNEKDELRPSEDLLWWLINYFKMCPDDFAKEVLVIRREPGDEYGGNIKKKKRAK